MGTEAPDFLEVLVTLLFGLLLQPIEYPVILGTWGEGGRKTEAISRPCTLQAGTFPASLLLFLRAAGQALGTDPLMSDPQKAWSIHPFV